MMYLIQDSCFKLWKIIPIKNSICIFFHKKKSFHWIQMCFLPLSDHINHLSKLNVIKLNEIRWICWINQKATWPTTFPTVNGTLSNWSLSETSSSIPAAMNLIRTSPSTSSFGADPSFTVSRKILRIWCESISSWWQIPFFLFTEHIKYNVAIKLHAIFSLLDMKICNFLAL